MSKFRVGDKVRRISSKFNVCGKTLMDVGDIDIITNISVNGLFLQLKNVCPDSCDAAASMFELVEYFTENVLTRDEFRDYIVKNGITKAKTTKDFYDVPKGTVLYFGVDHNSVKSYDKYVNNMNKDFGYDFDYSWRWSDDSSYDGSFELVDDVESKFPKNELIKDDMDIDEIKKFDKSVLAEAEKEAKEDIAEEQKNIAKVKFKELYIEVAEAERIADGANEKLAELKKDLKILTPKKKR